MGFFYIRIDIPKGDCLDEGLCGQSIGPLLKSRGIHSTALTTTREVLWNLQMLFMLDIPTEDFYPK
jgi:hypothetical protein